MHTIIDNLQNMAPDSKCKNIRVDYKLENPQKSSLYLMNITGGIFDSCENKFNPYERAWSSLLGWAMAAFWS